MKKHDSKTLLAMSIPLVAVVFISAVNKAIGLAFLCLGVAWTVMGMVKK
ncbi:MAG: hypothetical protein KJ939_03530 [Nanoarchaeota archaeon]|nr:hypothetical protein [Nanoarchaeota archaeon]MCG2720221.1 hypothetical protein [Nanoarchaeota archaeon]